MPFVLRRAYQNFIEDSEAENDLPFNGKEFLLSFDPTLGLEDFWVDAALFYLMNKLRNDMARRQNYGRGLPVQLSEGYKADPMYNITFDFEKEEKQEAPPEGGSRAKTKLKKSQEEPNNIYSELELYELQSLQVKYGHESSSLQFCHHCKQFKRKVIFAKCNFSSSRHKMIYPASTQVNGVKIYNAEGYL